MLCNYDLLVWIEMLVVGCDEATLSFKSRLSNKSNQYELSIVLPRILPSLK